MSLFSSKKNTETKAKTAIIKPAKAVSKKVAVISPEKAVKADNSSHFHTHDVSSVIIRPRVTEKGAILSESNTYLFEVSLRAHKNSVAEAIKLLYKVSPKKVSIVRVPVKGVWSKGKWGRTAGAKKAYVQLKKGDKIDFA